MVQTGARQRPAPPSWYYKLGLHSPAATSGRWLRAIRELLAGPNGRWVSQEVMADYLGVAEYTLRRYETGLRQLPYEIARTVSVQEMRLIGLGLLAVEDSSIGELFSSNAVPRSIQESTLTQLIEGFTAMRQRVVEQSWTKSQSSA